MPKARLWMILGIPDGLLVATEIDHGQRIAFSAALSNALLGKATNKVLILEAAELDEDNLARTLRNVAENHPDAQIIVNTCHEPVVDAIPKDWEVKRL